MYKRGQCWLVFVRPIRAPEKEIVPFVPTYASLKSTLAENLLPKKRDEIPITFWLGWLDAPTSPPYRLDAHERDHRLLVRGITVIKMTQEDYCKLEICVSQSLAKQRLRGRSRKKGKKATEKISLKKQTKQISKHDKYDSVLSLSVCQEHPTRI